MSTPFILVTTHKLDPDRLGELEAATEQYMHHVETNEPTVLAQYAYLSEDHTELSVVHVHPDAHSADRHMQVAGEQIGRGTALTDGNVRIEVYGGAPGPLLRNAVEANAANGTLVSVKTTGLAGFTRNGR